MFLAIATVAILGVDQMAYKVFRASGELETMLEEMARKFKGGTALNVGFFEGSTESDGVSTPYVAFVNEFGGTVPERTVPARVATIFKKVDRRGNYLLKGQS